MSNDIATHDFLHNINIQHKIFSETQIYRDWARVGLNPGKPHFTNKLKELWGKQCSNNPKVACYAKMHKMVLRSKFEIGQTRGLRHSCEVYKHSTLPFMTIEGYI